MEEAILYIEELQRQLKDRLEETLEEEERQHWEEMEEVVEKEEILEKEQKKEKEEQEEESLRRCQVWSRVPTDHCYLFNPLWYDQLNKYPMFVPIKTYFHLSPVNNLRSSQPITAHQFQQG